MGLLRVNSHVTKSLPQHVPAAKHTVCAGSDNQTYRHNVQWKVCRMHYSMMLLRDIYYKPTLI